MIKIYYVYILRCADNSLYTGITTDLEKRFNEHKNKKGAKYTKVSKKHPIKLAKFWIINGDKSKASKIEYHIKKNLNKKEKELIIKDDNLFKKEIINYMEIELLTKEQLDYCNQFYDEYKIDQSYKDFFNYKRVNEIKNLLSNVFKENFTPNKNDIFKVLKTDLKKMRVVILGMDPYPQEGVATGRAFEVLNNSWHNKSINSSLNNILKLIYKSYNNKVLTIAKIREEINRDNFKILPPDKIFKSWENQGVLLLNTALTTIIGEPGSHIQLWKPVISDLIKYIDENNYHLTFLLWGSKAKYFKKFIKNSVIIEHNHPAICGNLKNPNDFMNGESFSLTKNIINWLG